MNEPAPVTENEECKILWIFNVQTDHVIEARRPDMIIIDKVKKLCEIVDFEVPYDTKVNTKEVEKIENYKDLARELRKLCTMKVTIIPVIVGALGTTPKNICKRMEDIGIKTRMLVNRRTVLNWIVAMSNVISVHGKLGARCLIVKYSTPNNKRKSSSNIILQQWRYQPESAVFYAIKIIA